jgi:hypothetical protein
MFLQRVTDEPDCGRPKAHEECPSLRISPLILINRLRSDPKTDAEADGRHGSYVQVPASDS